MGISEHDPEHDPDVDYWRSAYNVQLDRANAAEANYQRQTQIANAQRQEASRARNQHRGAVEALEKIADSWVNPQHPRQDVRYQEAVRLANATLDQLRGR